MSGCSGVHLKLSQLSAHIPSDMSSIPCGAKMGNVIISGYYVGISARKSSQVKKNKSQCHENTWKYPESKVHWWWPLGKGRNWSNMDSHYTGSQVKLQNPFESQLPHNKAHSIEWRHVPTSHNVYTRLYTVCLWWSCVDVQNNVG